MVRGSKLLIHEATSTMGWQLAFGDHTCNYQTATIPLDYKTDADIQRALRTELGRDTTVAHRL
ncbi:hypothetical protein HYPSUDRAFT_66417 [Hypholoma sublateritium FD-334 SS-4]|uniref:Uncharacterized protein n=1 Tax=Hypholoma sublateritium (strain FD-334 SS-4) TaxID=945553 RepID=A0A0D2P3H3_HYPSF|nr:hypothetical protein HYPSUDRAFT_66417 [Hypholoma sublateritium FD-334 SS-4]